MALAHQGEVAGYPAMRVARESFVGKCRRSPSAGPVWPVYKHAAAASR
jgi:hypothetical protein